MAKGSHTGPLEAGLVTAAHGRRVKVVDGQRKIFNCTIRQRLHVVTGDRVQWRRLRGRQGVVESCEPRESELGRPDENGRLRLIAANINQVLVVTAPVPPIPDVVLDAYLVAAEALGLEARLLYNKADLVTPIERAAIEQKMDRYARAGYESLLVSAHEHQGMEQLSQWLTDRSSVFIGPSGVGKSSLTLELVPESNAQVGDLVGTGDHGAHTTTASRLYFLPHGGSIIDSPGIREFGLWKIPPISIANAFPEFRERADQCRFRDCLHLNEPDCAVLAAISQGEIASERYASYESLLRTYGEVERAAQTPR